VADDLWYPPVVGIQDNETCGNKNYNANPAFVTVPYLEKTRA
jgi:hypothetical protein